MEILDFILRWVLSGVIAWCVWFLGMEVYIVSCFKLDKDKYALAKKVLHELCPDRNGDKVRGIAKTIIWPWGLIEDSRMAIKCVETTLERYDR